MLRKIVFFSLMISAAAIEAQVAPRAIELDDYFRIESADEPAISPDGRFVAFTRHYVAEEDNRRRSEIWLAPSDGSVLGRRITIPAFDASAPRFSPDGNLLTFRSKRDGASTWFLHTDRPGEAFRIPGVDGPALVSPDGRFVAFTKETPPEIAAPAPSDLEKELDERFEGQIYDWMQFRYDGRGYLTDPANPYASPAQELYVVSAEGGEPQRLTSLGVDVLDFSWSPDGRRIVFTADAHQRDEYVYERADLWLVGLAGDVRRLTDDGYHHSSPRFSPDGSRIAYRRMKGLSLVIAEKAKSGAPVDMYVMNLESDETTNVTERWDLRPGDPVWSADGGGLYFDAGIGGNQHLFRASAIEPGSVHQVTEGDRWLSDFSFTPDGSRMAFAAETGTSPSDVYVAAVDGSSENKLSRFGETYASELVLSAPERIAFPSRDGTEIEGWVLFPAGYGPDNRSPIILSIHGGPHGAYGNRFDFQFQLWATAGYVVLYTNPRGSSGYGEEFMFATWGGGWGNLDTEDVLAGVDYVRSRYAIDERRMGVTGYSYGGFLTNWVITHDARFAAAIVGAGISNWISDYGTADIPRTKESEFYGPPWEDEGGTLLQRQSPIHYVQNVVTPTLFVHGESDYRVPIEQGEQMYTALKKRRVPAKFIRYPDSYHGDWTPWNVVHRYHHELEWWKKYLSAPSGTSQ